MIVDQAIDRHISKILTQEDEEKRAKHTPSGRLSASALGSPLQWQMLRMLGVPSKTIDPYTLRKFRRGEHVEDWLIAHLNPVKSQQEVLYRDAIGYVDAVCDTSEWDFPRGTIPVEIKSVTNAKYKYITKGNKPDQNHVWQACLYALAMETEWFAVVYVATDDYRTHTFLLETAKYKDEVDQIITRFKQQQIAGVVPVFEPKFKYQATIKYSNYPEWMSLTEEEISKKLSVDAPEAFEKLNKQKGGRDNDAQYDEHIPF